MTNRFNPSVEEVRKRREDTGNGLVDCKRELLRRNLTQALEGIKPKTESTKVLRDVLLTMIEEKLV